MFAKICKYFKVNVLYMYKYRIYTYFCHCTRVSQTDFQSSLLFPFCTYCFRRRKENHSSKAQNIGLQLLRFHAVYTFNSEGILLCSLHSHSIYLSIFNAFSASLFTFLFIHYYSVTFCVRREEMEKALTQYFHSLFFLSSPPSLFFSLFYIAFLCFVRV